jgi:DNA-binding transcriptional MerR regulator
MRTYRTMEIQELTGVPKDQIVYWARTNVFEPYEDVRGRGKSRQYSWENLIEIMICRELNRVGIGPELMAKILSHLRNEEFLYYVNVSENETGRCSFWQHLKRKPETKLAFLTLNYEAESAEASYRVCDRHILSKQFVEVGEFKTLVAINIQALIEEVGRE